MWNPHIYFGKREKGIIENFFFFSFIYSKQVFPRKAHLHFSLFGNNGIHLHPSTICPTRVLGMSLLQRIYRTNVRRQMHEMLVLWVRKSCWKSERDQNWKQRYYVRREFPWLDILVISTTRFLLCPVRSCSSVLTLAEFNNSNCCPEAKKRKGKAHESCYLWWKFFMIFFYIYFQIYRSAY